MAMHFFGAKLSTGCWIRLQHLPTSTHLFSSSLISSTLFLILLHCYTFYCFVLATFRLRHSLHCFQQIFALRLSIKGAQNTL
jgi:hypothetical protein